MSWIGEIFFIIVSFCSVSFSLRFLFILISADLPNSIVFSQFYFIYLSILQSLGTNSIALMYYFHIFLQYLILIKATTLYTFQTYQLATTYVLTSISFWNKYPHFIPQVSKPQNQCLRKKYYHTECLTSGSL